MIWFKGAIVAFYLRRHDVEENGAAFIPREDVPELFGRALGPDWDARSPPPPPPPTPNE
jgi:hypothetical protein